MIEKLKELLGNLKSRKVILLVLGVVYTLLTFFKDEVGISLDPEAVVTTMAVIVVYIFGEFKLDMKKITGLIGSKWADPKFWMAILGALLPVFAAVFGLNIPVKIITGMLAAVVGLLFKRKSMQIA